MRKRQFWRVILSSGVLALVAHPAAAITLKLDYSYDTGGFFGSGNPQGAAAGAQAKAALDAAASFYSAILTDTFDPIIVPAHYHSTYPDSTGDVTWSWQAKFPNPSDDSATQVSITNLPVAADEYIIFPGGSSLPGTQAGEGGFGGYSYAKTITGTNQFTQSDLNTIDSRNTSFVNQITTRGEVSGFSRWGGAVTFDDDGSTNWFFDRSSTPSGNVTDFYSVAIHEIAHTLGFGLSTDWQNLINGSTFTGQNSKNLNGGNPVPLAPAPDLAHWAQGTTSVVYGTNTPQEVEMDPSLQNGTRKKLTALDAAGLKDIGWSLGAAPGTNGDYNNNGIVDAADYTLWRKNLAHNVTLPNDTTPGMVTAVDYTVWRTNFGNGVAGSGSGFLAMHDVAPEPASALLLFMGVVFYSVCRSRRK
jgi:hypothetical protein